MLKNIINFSIKNKLIIFLFTAIVIGFGIYSLKQIPIGAVPDVTNNQIQVLTTSQNLSTQDIEQFITYPVELEMANIPGVIEIRSISKFGLSVVTIVFEESMGTYLPRQLIAEKLTAVKEKIPKGFGVPEMGPITTGLGEIYQYILDTKEGYKDKYTATDLRTIQDWIVKRQLSGIKGVVEVNTWGGFLKQYEVAINTEKLKAMNITIAEIYTALEENNSVAGGGYIEKNNQAFFIRGEGLMSSFKDIKNTIVKNVNGIPILIKDIAKVGFGSAIRFGAITGNGEGEKVLGQVMMLKGANSKQVIEDVKERVKLIEKTLPEGVYINGFLDRSELIAKTTFTVYENLILGSLIVIFVVVLLLGSFRSGLVVASVIPLALLFTLGMMYIFGIDANLMSLGAIDFGIIIDGAVIIVEFIAFQISSKQQDFTLLNKVEKQKLKDNITLESASKMMSSAIFGQLIILIVFIPILTLGGIEGKMFKPMAMTFSFALIGAIIFGLTFVPVIASLVIKPNKEKDNISKKLMRFLTNIYESVIRWALCHKKVILISALTLLISSVFIFKKLGAEFVPTLDEGDFVIQPVLKTGTSLKETVKITTKIEQILKNNFPEVKQIISRIGAAEVPTDPMSMEESDVIITLKPKKEWVSAKTKDELANKMKEALTIIPNMEIEFTQPIEMRFNELISGVRSDIAIKIFGEDLDILAKKANEIKNEIKNVVGASDITVEKTAGLPEMNVKFNRGKMARYGINIKEVNNVISMGFSGYTLGSIYEGEKRFDLVMRLDKDKRQDITNLKDLLIDLPNGNKIPLSEIATISNTKGIAKISRDDTRRRVVVGINVRDRDLQSVVDDMKQIIDAKIKLPVGYTINYGGQFENLQSAKTRLKIAVPIALFLIFVLLYFAFKSVKEALLIYTAIPFSAVGGILFLWLRDLPFSISAGVGFIALFGIAVLNGIVLIEEFKELKSKNDLEGDDLIVIGAVSRLRAVLLTATAAALGFLPMAISNGAGAEVQRPLATVVIGGLITSTLLTLLVLPVLYTIFHKLKNNNMKSNKKNIAILLILFSFMSSFSQNNSLDLIQLQELALTNNGLLKNAKLVINKESALINTAFDFDKTEVFYNYQDTKDDISKARLHILGIVQDFDFPTVYKTQKKINLSSVVMQEIESEILKDKILYTVTLSYYEFQYAKARENVYLQLDSLYQKFSYQAKRKFELGETNYLESITAKAKQNYIKTLLKQSKSNVTIAKEKVREVIQSDDMFTISKSKYKKLTITEFDLASHKSNLLYNENKNKLNSKLKHSKQQYLPSFNLEYNYGRSPFYNGQYNVFQVGLKIPFLAKSKKATVNASKISLEIANQEHLNNQNKLSATLKLLEVMLNKHNASLQYFETEGNNLSKEILKTANLSYKHGEIDFFQYIQSIESVYEMELNYLKNLYQFNQTVIKINYLNIEQ